MVKFNTQSSGLLAYFFFSLTKENNCFGKESKR